MEHLGPNLINARHGLNRVPLFADLQLPLKGGFHTLHRSPSPIGWVVDDDGTNRPDESNPHIVTQDKGQPNEPFTVFVQRWLWFEVLRGILGHLPGFDLHKFVRRDLDNKPLVTTTELPGYLKQWYDSELQNRDVRRQVQAHRILEQARIFVSKYCAVSVDRERPDWSIDQKVALSIMVLGETLTAALIRIQQDTKSEVRGWNTSTQGWGYSKAVLDILREKEKVCPNKVHMLKGLFQNNTIGLLYALELLPRGTPWELHDNCNARRCSPVLCYLPKATGYQLKAPLIRREPEPIHDWKCKGTCNLLGPNTEELSRIIQKDKIPLLQYNKDTATLTLVEMSKSIDKRYVVFSHVWADGYGNPTDNKMNSCVLDRFVQLFKDVGDSRKQPVAIASKPFWIDTLAIPVEKKYKAQRKKAIKSMHSVYRGAECTIVLDAGLMDLSRGEGYAQPAMSISVSKWMTRLWTLQEAVFSKELYFNFSDELVSMDRLEALFRKEDASLHPTVAFASRTYYHGILKKESQAMRDIDSKPEDRKIKPEYVAAVWKALQWRTTANPSHETLALATLLDIDTDDFVDPRDGSQTDGRMQKLLGYLSACRPCPIPPGMIFLPGPRLLEKGYRWAPQTWLSSRPVEPPDALTLKCPKARLNIPHGLEVKFPGFLLYRPPKAQRVFAQGNEFYFPTGLSLGQWYCILLADEEAENICSRKLAIIASRLPVIHPKEIALLVAVDRQPDDIFYVNILHRVWINEVSDPKKLEALRDDYHKAHDDSLWWGEILSIEQCWCVDGLEAARSMNVHDDNAADENPKALQKRSTWSRIFGA